MNTDFAKITTAILEGYGLSEGELAKKIGTSQPSIHRIKNGSTEMPNYGLGAKLVKLYSDLTDEEAA